MKLNLDLFGSLYFDRQNCILATLPMSGGQPVMLKDINRENQYFQLKKTTAKDPSVTFSDRGYIVWSWKFAKNPLAVIWLRNNVCCSELQSRIWRNWRNGLNFDWWLRSRKTFPVIACENSRSSSLPARVAFRERTAVLAGYSSHCFPRF